MNPFVLPLSQLLHHWKELRTNLKTQDEASQLQSVVDFWSLSPLSTFAHDPEALDTYETPWEMMHHNDWCQNSVAVAMEFTLRLGGAPTDKLIIRMIRDHDVSVQRLVVEFDGKYWLNYEHGIVSALPETNYDVLDTWKFNGKRYERI